ncbi:MAG TPA: polymer-forming cytoskeletal protein [Micropepsaceae bacterium]|jgi:cytoskeletal protein CcmA (bactofilin family)|nr:polymer-forming cytoskeletal protein [Micropepsaceae bacterium]
MFSKTKETPKETEAAPIAPPQPAPPPPKRPARNGGVPSIISAELIVRGTLISQGDVQVDGRVDGDIRAAGLVIGEKANITGDVYADEATVRGRVEGSIRARKVQLCATCHVEGNILHEALSMESGAFFEGNCRHSDNPLADAPQPTASERKASSAGATAGTAKPAGTAV